MATAFLDDDEVYILTGYKKPKLQKAWLARLNIPFEENISRLKKTQRASQPSIVHTFSQYLAQAIISQQRKSLISGAFK
ncbi:MAG: DUF4224 domain-containing protein [Symbiopectobacterium sp.]